MSAPATCPFAVGKITVMSLGALVDAPNFYRDPSKTMASDILVFPVGYKIQRMGPAKDVAASGEEVPYIAEVKSNEDGSAPVFVVTPSDCPEDAVAGGTASIPWQQLHSQRVPSKSSSVTGFTKFGLNDKRIVSELRLLEGGAELFEKLESLNGNQKTRQQPVRNTVAPRSFSQEQGSPQTARSTGSKTKRSAVEICDANGNPVNAPGVEGVLGAGGADDVQVIPINIDSDAPSQADGLPAKKPRKPRPNRNLAAGSGAGSGMVQQSIEELFSGKKTGAGVSFGAGLRPLCDRTENSKAKLVFTYEFEKSKEHAAAIKSLGGDKLKIRSLCNFLFQYTSEQSKHDLMKRHNQVIEAQAKEAAAQPPASSTVTAPAAAPKPRSQQQLAAAAQPGLVAIEQQHQEQSMNLIPAQSAGSATKKTPSKRTSNGGTKAASSARKSVSVKAPTAPADNNSAKKESKGRKTPSARPASAAPSQKASVTKAQSK